MAVPPPAPALSSEDTTDEAEIQFRAAFLFYRRARWEYAVPAFAEVKVGRSCADEDFEKLVNISHLLVES